MSHTVPVVVIPARAPTRRAPSRAPLYRTMGYTLDISARFLASGLVGRGTIARADELLDGWAQRIFRSGNASLEVHGRERLEPGAPYVFMSNHRSLLDIPAMFAAVPGSLRMVLKQELCRVPVWGRALVASGFIPIDRGNTARAIQQLELAKERLHQGVSVWISPEGTRSRTGALGPFKKGGFHIARDLGVPIVPVWIEGTDTIIPPDNFVARYDGEAQVRFGPPVTTTDVEIPALMEQVRAAMLALAPTGPATEDGAPATPDVERPHERRPA